MKAPNIDLTIDGKASDSALVEMIWQAKSEQSGTFISTAATHWEMVVTQYQGKTSLTVRGPETRASQAEYPAEAEFFGIVFKLGTFMPHLPIGKLLNRHDKTLPEANSQAFWLHGAAWEFPEYENVETFIARLVREELLVREPVVEAVLANRPLDLSLRTVQRRFLHATGLTRGTLDQIERAHQAAALLEKGTSIADAVFQAGYADQPHLTRSLKQLVGQTPGQILQISSSH